MSKLQDYIDRYRGIHHGRDEFLFDGRAKKSQKLFDGSNFLEKLMPAFDKRVEQNDSFTVLDYGSGKALHLHKRVLDKQTFHERYAGKVQGYYCYDPGYEPYARKPHPEMKFDYVICADVMEHIPEEHVDEVLQEIGRHVNRCAFFSISGDPAYKSFGDGENLHCTMHDHQWWTKKIIRNVRKPFYIVHTQDGVEKKYWMMTKPNGNL